MIRFGRRKLSRVPARSKATGLSATRHTPSKEGFAEDEERFFNEPEASSARLTADVPAEAPFSSTLAPTVMDEAQARAPANGDQARDTLPGVAVLQTRRARLRRAVIITLCASGAILLLGITRRSTPGARSQASAGIHLTRTPATGASVASLTPRALDSGSRPETPALPIAIASASVPTGGDHESEQSARALVLKARSLLQAGRIRAGVAAARQALDANSSDAEPYILLAAGLQDLGDWSGAQSVFAECNQKAKRGSSSDCRYFSSR